MGMVGCCKIALGTRTRMHQCYASDGHIGTQDTASRDLCRWPAFNPSQGSKARHECKNLTIVGSVGDERPRPLGLLCKLRARAATRCLT